jgi:RNA polymerase sigma-70 factor (sigma-E family)
MSAPEYPDFSEFVQTMQHRMRRSAFLMTGDWAMAADLTQEALVKLYIAWPRIRQGDGVGAYAQRTLVTTVLDHQRFRRRRPETPRAELEGDVGPDAASLLADREVLLSALRRLAPRQRACVVLRYFEGLSVAETAAAMGCSEGNVKSQTSIALRSLRRMLDDDELRDAVAAEMDSAMGGAR